MAVMSSRGHDIHCDMEFTIRVDRYLRKIDSRGRHRSRALQIYCVARAAIVAGSGGRITRSRGRITRRRTAARVTGAGARSRGRRIRSGGCIIRRRVVARVTGAGAGRSAYARSSSARVITFCDSGRRSRDGVGIDVCIIRVCGDVARCRGSSATVTAARSTVIATAIKTDAINICTSHIRMMSRVREHLHCNGRGVCKPVLEVLRGLNTVSGDSATCRKSPCRQEETGHNYEHS